jgi:predicted transcriptional regulator of viral defense system
LYSSANLQPSSLEIANLIYRPSCISLEIALSYYHVIPETVYAITSVTTKHSKDIKVLNQIYRYHQISKGLYFGYQTIRVANKNVIIATKEKALLDYLYFVARGQKKYNERFDLRLVDKEKLRKYSKIFFKNINNTHIKKRFGLLLARINL